MLSQYNTLKQCKEIVTKMLLNSFIKKINNKYGTIDKKQIAQSMWKKTVDAGSAVVNVLGATGIAGFKFHVPETELVKFESDITDHFTDTNSAIQDHIALKPITITSTGLVGDYFYSVNQIEDFLALIVPTITLVKEFIPQIRAITQKEKTVYKTPESRAYKQEDGNYKIDTGADTARYSFNGMDLFALFQSLYKLKSAQTRAFLFFEAMRKARATFSVETTWKRYDNMAIQSLSAKRDNNADITEFSITFKQLEFTETKVESLEEYKNRMEQQKSKVINKGTEKGEEIDINTWNEIKSTSWATG